MSFRYYSFLLFRAIKYLSSFKLEFEKKLEKKNYKGFDKEEENFSRQTICEEFILEHLRSFLLCLEKSFSVLAGQLLQEGKVIFCFIIFFNFIRVGIMTKIVTDCKKITLKLFYTYVDGKITTKKAGKDTTYFNLIRRPKSTFGLSLGSDLTKHLYVSTQLNAVGKRTDITYDASFNPVAIDLKSYILWDLYAAYAVLKNKFKVFIDLHNITKAKYTEVYGFNTMGFTVSGGVRFNF